MLDDLEPDQGQPIVVTVPGVGILKFPAGTNLQDPKIVEAMRRLVAENTPKKDPRVESVMGDVESDVQGQIKRIETPYGKHPDGTPVAPYGGTFRKPGPESERLLTDLMPVYGGMMGSAFGGPAGRRTGLWAGQALGSAMAAGAGAGTGEAIRAEVMDEPANIGTEAAWAAGPELLFGPLRWLGNKYKSTAINHDMWKQIEMAEATNPVTGKTTKILDAQGKPAVKSGLDEYGRRIPETITEDFSKGMVPSIGGASTGPTGGLRAWITPKNASPRVGRFARNAMGYEPTANQVVRALLMMMGQGETPTTISDPVKVNR